MTLVASSRVFDAQGNLKPLRDTNETDLFTKPCGTLHYSKNYLGNLMVVGRYGITVDGRAKSVQLSADGRGWIDAWHDASEHGPGDGGTVYVEKYEANGHAIHGWIDATSRRVAQVG